MPDKNGNGMTKNYRSIIGVLVGIVILGMVTMFSYLSYATNDLEKHKVNKTEYKEDKNHVREDIKEVKQDIKDLKNDMKEDLTEIKELIKDSNK
jgi:DNA-binding protein H-NS